MKSLSSTWNLLLTSLATRSLSLKRRKTSSSGQGSCIHRFQHRGRSLQLSMRLNSHANGQATWTVQLSACQKAQTMPLSTRVDCSRHQRHTRRSGRNSSARKSLSRTAHYSNHLNCTVLLKANHRSQVTCYGIHWSQKARLEFHRYQAITYLRD